MSDRIHIICSRPQADRILPRLARYLAEANGWSLSDKPDPSADLNYALNYLECSQNNRGWHETPFAAWFTHYDAANAAKAKLWDFAAAHVDLRTVTAEQYALLLRPLGQTVTVLPPVELDRFTPREPRETDRPIVGVSGYVYGDDRKGESLVAKLAQSKLAESVELRACGRGWPIPTRSYSWPQMHEYYRSLDVYLCTALIEGVPMPPLEAMACGIPVVIPRGVGLLDELPSVENMYRYDAGDYQSMEAALERAVDAARRGPLGVNVESLRGVAARFTLERWAEGHREAFEQLLHPKAATPAPPAWASVPDWQGRAGAFVVAYGDPARECASQLFRSIREHMPSLPICLVSDRPLGGEDIFQQYPDLDVAARKPKTRIYDLFPKEWDYCLYLDSDVELMADVSRFFEWLQDGWEFVICTNPGKYHMIKEAKRPDNQPEFDATVELLGAKEILQLAGGVFAFRRTEGTARLMRTWHAEWERWAGRDQLALLRALHQNPVRTLVLSVDWNAPDRYVSMDRKPLISHHQMAARRWKPGTFLGRTNGAEAWAAVHPTGRP